MTFFRSARYYHWSLDNDFKPNDEQRQIYYHQLSPLMSRKLFNIIANEQFNPYEFDRLSPVSRRAKAIVKGDPREFMG